MYTYVMNNPLTHVDPSGHIQQATDNYKGVNGIGYLGEVVTNPVTDAMANGVLGGMKAAGEILDFLVVSDITTLTDPNSSKFDSGEFYPNWQNSQGRQDLDYHEEWG